MAPQAWFQGTPFSPLLQVGEQSGVTDWKGLGVNSPRPQGVWGRRTRGQGSARPPELLSQHLRRLLQLLSPVRQPLHVMLLVGSEMGCSAPTFKGRTPQWLPMNVGQVSSHSGSQPWSSWSPRAAMVALLVAATLEESRRLTWPATRPTESAIANSGRQGTSKGTQPGCCDPFMR